MTTIVDHPSLASSLLRLRGYNWIIIISPPYRCESMTIVRLMLCDNSSDDKIVSRGAKKKKATGGREVGYFAVVQ